MSGPIVHGGGITAVAAEFGGRPEDWLDLSTGINPCPVKLPEIPQSAWHRLPDRHLLNSTVEAARDYYRSGPLSPLPVPGTQSVIQLLPRLVVPGSRVAVVSPTYAEYEKAFRSAGCEVDTVSSLDEIGDGTMLAVAVNPNNPTARLHDRDGLIRLHETLKARGGYLVVDEAFGDIERGESLVPSAAELSNLIIFRSFGKFFGLAGLRLGFVIAQDSLRAKFEDWLGPWAVSGPALSIATALLRSDPAPIAAGIAERNAGLVVVLEAAGLAVTGNAALFTLVEDKRAGDLYRHLCRHHILVRRFDYAPHWLRFGLGPDRSADRRLAAALESFDA
jgi:cobalamin biosynthesis protein CobC